MLMSRCLHIFETKVKRINVHQQIFGFNKPCVCLSVSNFVLLIPNERMNEVCPAGSASHPRPQSTINDQWKAPYEGL